MELGPLVRTVKNDLSKQSYDDTSRTMDADHLQDHQHPAKLPHPLGMPLIYWLIGIPILLLMTGCVVLALRV